MVTLILNVVGKTWERIHPYALKCNLIIFCGLAGIQEIKTKAVATSRRLLYIRDPSLSVSTKIRLSGEVRTASRYDASIYRLDQPLETEMALYTIKKLNLFDKYRLKFQHWHRYPKHRLTRCFFSIRHAICISSTLCNRRLNW